MEPELHFHFHFGDHKQIFEELGHIRGKLETILMTEQEALAAITAVQTKTTEIGVAVGAEGDTIQKVNDALDAILAGKAGTVPDSVAAALETLLTPLQGAADNLGAHETLLKAILVKGQPPVPVTPLPVPTPAPNVP